MAEAPGSKLKEAVEVINSCYPEEIVRYYRQVASLQWSMLRAHAQAPGLPAHTPPSPAPALNCSPSYSQQLLEKLEQMAATA
jgi:hypothetical protein